MAKEATFQILLNEKPVPCYGTTTVHALLDEKDFASRKGIAVALNESVVPREKWKMTELRPGDSILIITATQGG